MGLNPPLAGLALGLCLAAASARAEDCPAKSTMMDDVIAALNEAFVNHSVLVIRDQHLLPPQVLDAVQLFGAVFHQHNTKFALPD